MCGKLNIYYFGSHDNMSFTNILNIVCNAAWIEIVLQTLYCIRLYLLLCILSLTHVFFDSSNNMNKTNTTPYQLHLYFTHIGIGSVCAILDTVICVVFLTSKALRCNMFYRILFPLFVFHFLGATSITIRCELILFDVDIKYLCSFLSLVGLTSRLLSASQTAIISADRYQATFITTTSTLQRRRRRLGVVAIIVAIFVILVYTTLWGIDMDPTCDSMMSHDKTEDVIAGIATFWIIVNIFLLEIPFTTLTAKNIKQRSTKIGVSVIFTVPRSTASHRQTRIINCTPPSIQKKMKIKIQALKILILLVVCHIITFLPQIGLLIAFRGYDNYQKLLLGCNIILTLTNYTMDGLLCMLLIKPFRERIGMSYRIIKCEKWKKNKNKRKQNNTLNLL